MPMHCCFSDPQQLFFEPKGRGNALSLPKHPIATRSGLKVHPGCSKPQPDHSRAMSVTHRYQFSCPKSLHPEKFFRADFENQADRKLFKISAEIQSAEKPQETRRWIRNKNKREIIKNLEVLHESRTYIYVETRSVRLPYTLLPMWHS